MDGVKLNDLEPGCIREVSSTIGWWLIAQGYAEPEMRAPRDPDRTASRDSTDRLKDRRNPH